MQPRKLLLICAALALAGYGSCLQCVGQNGKNIEWWVVLKYPLGYRSTYLDSASVSGCQEQGSCWSTTFDVRSDNAVTNTIQLAKKNGAGYLFYNDADPGSGKEMWMNAHAKGVVAFDEQSGIWIVHSAPKYPDRTSEWNWWVLRPPQSKFGQHFACVSLTQQSTDSLARILALADVYVYDTSNLTSQLTNLYPNLARFMGYGSTASLRGREWSLQAALATTEGTNLTAFTKAPSPRKPLHMHEEVIEAAYKVAMLWETWRPGGEPSACPQHGYSSFNNKAIRVPETGAAWQTEDDHSKWGISFEDTLPVACFGDLNRAESQAKRGGSYLCWNQVHLWNAVHKLVVDYEQCSSEHMDTDQQAAKVAT